MGRCREVKRKELEESAPARELKRMKFTEVPEDFSNILLQDQQLIMAATDAAKSAAFFQ